MITPQRSREARYLILAALLPCCLLLPALLQPSRLIYPLWADLSDLTLIHWPKVLLIRESLAQGYGWPLWSPYALGGQPLAANQLAMIFYPPALLLLVGPLAWSFSLFYALHLAWAGIGTYCLVRGLGRHHEAALLAAAIFALSGKLMAHTAIGHVSLVAAIAWTPWALAFLHRALAGRSLVYALLTGVALAAQATTHTYALVYTAYGLILYAALYLFMAQGSLGVRVRAALAPASRLAVVPVVAVLLAAAQLLPLLEMAGHSNRSLSLAEATLFSLSPTQTLMGSLLPTPNVGHEWIVYTGLVTLFLVSGAWNARRERSVLIFGSLVLCGILLALGSYTPLYRLAYTLVPGLRWMRTPGRLWFFVSLGLAVLAAYGLEAWGNLWRHPSRRRARLLLVAAMGFALTLCLGVMLITGQRGRGVWGLGVFGLLSGVLLLWAIGRQPSPLFPWLTLLLLVADLLSFDYILLRFAPREQVLAMGREAAVWLAAQPGVFRTYSPSYSLPQPAVSEAGLAQIDGVEPVHLADYDRFMALAGGYGSRASFSVTIPPFPDGVSLEEAHRDTIPNLRLLGLLNGQYLAASFPMNLDGLIERWQDTGIWVYENEHALPRALVVHQAGPTTHEEVWDRLETLDPAQLALAEGGRLLNGPGESKAAEIVEQAPDRLVVKADLGAPGLLLLSEIWYPGWRALDNGSEVPIFRTDAVLRGVYLDPGPHTVEFDYRPWTVRVGLVISGLTALALFGGIGWHAWKRP